MSKIERIDDYKDERFNQKPLIQHGCYIINHAPYEIEIIDSHTAIVRGEDNYVFPELIEEFRFHAPHITYFKDEAGRLIKKYPTTKIFSVEISSIQPSQFYIDEDKMTAVSQFIFRPEDIVVQLMKWNDRYISLDGHTRLYYAVKMGYSSVLAVISEEEEWVWAFVKEARKRNVFVPADMKLISHEEYEIEWNQFCDKVFDN